MSANGHPLRNAVITGGASGIGLAVARRFARDGIAVSLWDRDESTLAAAARSANWPRAPHTVSVEITDASAVERATQATIEVLGSIEILVNSAGITGPNVTTWDYPVEEWQRVIDVDLTGTFLCCRAIVPHMRERNTGRIVNIASIAGKEGNPNAAAYSAAKAGVIALTKSLGKELAATSIRVNCVTPAAVESPMFAQMTQAHIDYMLSKIPMGRFGQADEIAAMIAWLSSDECSFSTGAVFDCSGGRATY